MTPDERADALQEKYGPMFKRLKAAAADVANEEGNKERRYIKLVKLADANGRLVQEQAPCRRGCSSCCHMAVPIPMLEAERLARATGRTLNPAAGLPAAIAAVMLNQNVPRFSGVPCTFLVDGQCSVYRDRPIACREHYSAESSPEKCDMRVPDELVAGFDSHWLDGVLVAITHDELYADIRDWFSIGKGSVTP